jgi:hypothetical protein
MADRTTDEFTGSGTMSLRTNTGLSGHNITTFTDLAAASYEPMPDPAGWTTLTADDLGLPESMFDGPWYEDSSLFGGEDARIMQSHEGTLALAFRGTDTVWEVHDYPGLLADPTAFATGGTAYIHNFDNLLDAVADYAQDPANGVDDLWVTGHSLGAGAVNQLHDVAHDTDKYDNVFDDAEFVSFAAPNLDNEGSNNLNLGFDNDWVYRSTNLHNVHENESGTDDFFYYNDKYAEGETKSWSVHGLHGPNGEKPYSDAIGRLVDYGIWDQAGMDRDTQMVVDAYDGHVAPPDAGDDAVLLGERNAADEIDGGAGDDLILGGFGNDTLKGEQGEDAFAFPTTTVAEGGRTRIEDFWVEDQLIFDGLLLDAPQDGPGHNVGKGEIDVLNHPTGNTSLYVGADHAPGHDFEVSLDGYFPAEGFKVAGNAMTYHPDNLDDPDTIDRDLAPMATVDGYDTFMA